MTMDNNNSLRYLVNSKKGVIWVSVGDTPWKMESDVRVEPKKYFNTLRGIFYLRKTVYGNEIGARLNKCSHL